MKKIVLLILMILLMIFTALSKRGGAPTLLHGNSFSHVRTPSQKLVHFASFHRVSIKETIQKEFNVQKGKMLNFDMRGRGDVNITGWKNERSAITIHFKESSPDQWDIRFNETPKGIEIEIDDKDHKINRDSRLDVEIRVPVQFDLKLRVVGGNLGITGIEGDMKGKTLGGNLELKNLKGTIDLKTTGGDITLTDSELDGRLRSIGGRVMFENVTGDVEGISSGGDVIHRNIGKRAGGSGGKAIRISSQGGDINISDAPEGADVHTAGGNIRIKSAAKFVKAVTAAGDIVITAVDGYVRAVTAAGDIDVTVTGGTGKEKRDVTLIATVGSITLTVPEDFSMDIDTRLSYTKNARAKYKITSDFPLKIEETGEWDSRDGKDNPRKDIYGKAKIAGGKHKIKILTVNGNIYLKKHKK